MIPFVLSPNTPHEFKFNMPNSWEDVTVKQFFELKKWDGKDSLMLLSILSGVDYNKLTHTLDYTIDDNLWPLTSFLKEDISKVVTEQTHIEIKGKLYPIPKQINSPGNGQRFVLAQKNAMRDKMIATVNKTGDAINCAEFIVACYFYPIVNGIEFDTSDNPKTKFRSEDAEEFIKELQEVRIVELYAVSTFFLQKLIGWQIERQPDLALNQVKNKKLRRLISWMFSKKLTRLTLLPRVTYYDGKESLT
jgi:hypothetical protein